MFNLEKIGEENGHVILSDGIFNLALLAAPKGLKTGLRYLGFAAARMEWIGKKLEHWEGERCRSTNAPTVRKWMVERAIRTAILSGLIGAPSIRLTKRRRCHSPHRAVRANPRCMADFYCSILNMREVERTDRGSIFVTDGYINVALLFQRKEEPLGLNHFGFHVKSNEDMRLRAERAGVRPGAKRPARIPFAEYRVHDPEGNGFDISEKGFRVEPK